MAKGEMTIALNEKDLARMNKILDSLTELERVAALQKGMSEAVQLFKRQGQSNLEATTLVHPHNVRMAEYMAKKHGGSLKNAFGTWTKKHFRGNGTREKTVAGYAGFYKKKGGGIAHMPDAGTKPRYTKQGWYRGTVRKGGANSGSRFWHRAVETKGGEALYELFESVRKSIMMILQKGH